MSLLPNDNNNRGCFSCCGKSWRQSNRGRLDHLKTSTDDGEQQCLLSQRGPGLESSHLMVFTWMTSGTDWLWLQPFLLTDWLTLSYSSGKGSSRWWWRMTMREKMKREFGGGSATGSSPSLRWIRLPPWLSRRAGCSCSSLIIIFFFIFLMMLRHERPKDDERVAWSEWEDSILSKKDWTKGSSRLFFFFFWQRQAGRESRRASGWWQI